MQITNSKLNDYILYSNKNMEKLCSKIISESANAVLLEMFEDKMLLADHVSGGIYLADYNFDAKNATLTLENFEDIDIVSEEPVLKNAINTYFEDDGYDVGSLVEAYEEESYTNSNELSESITEALSSKNIRDIADYTQLIGINEECEELKTLPFFKTYSNYLTESPTSSIKFIDWVNPVRVSLISEDTNRILTFSSRNKAEKLTKSADFRNEFGKAVREMYEGDSEYINSLLSENYSLLSLGETELKEFVTMSIVTDKDLMEDRKEIMKELNEVISEDEVLSGYKDVLSESDDAEESATEEDKALSVNEKDTDALLAALDKALNNITDEKLTKKIEDLKDALETSKSEGTTDVEAVKESVELLSF